VGVVGYGAKHSRGARKEGLRVGENA